MANYDTIIPAIIQHFTEQVYLVEPVGAGTLSWRAWNDETCTLEDTGDRVRLFEIYADRFGTPSLPNAVMGYSTDYDMTINIDICYHIKDAQTYIGLRDFEEIRHKIMLSDTSSITGFNFARFEEIEWIDSQVEDAKFRYMRIPIMCRITVDHT
jgi:hypothetical protein